MLFKELPPMNRAYILDAVVRMAHHSTAIEGNSLTLGETKSILIDGYIPRPMDLREFYEVANYKNFAPFLEAFAPPITIETIRQVHAILCRNTIEHAPGEFKIVQNMIVGVDFLPTPPYMVRTALHEWIANGETALASSTREREKIEAICRQHIAFERIHPFPDGNGRTGRALATLQCKAASLPPLIIPVERRKEYMHLLNAYDVPGLADMAQELMEKEKERMIAHT